MSSTKEGRLYRIVPSLVAALVFFGIGALWIFDRRLYLMVMHHYIWTLATTPPFSDLDAVLRAGACWHQGVDVYLPNDCMGGGRYNYSPVLLRIGLLGAGPAAWLTIGVLLNLLFIVACAFLPPARTLGELVVRNAMLSSCAVAHGIEAGNIDLAIFVLVMAGLLLQRASFAGRLAGYAIFLFCGALKFYPAVLLALLLRENRSRVACMSTVLAVAAVIVVWRHGPELNGILTTLPLGLPFRGSFGAINLVFGLTLLAFMSKPSVLPESAVFGAALHHPHLAVYVIIGTKCLVVAGLVSGLQLAPRYASGLAALDDGRRLCLVAGAVLLAFCFYTAPNYEYRGVFLLFTLPGLYAMAEAPDRHGGMWAGLMVALMPLLLWERVLWEGFRRIGEVLPGHALAAGLGIALWVLREYAWWFIMVRLTAIVIVYLQTVLNGLLAGSGMSYRDEACGS